MQDQINSDMKKFIQDDDDHLDEQARIDNEIGRKWREKLEENRMTNRAIKVDGGEMKIEDLQETPRHIKDRSNKDQQQKVGSLNMFG